MVIALSRFPPPGLAPGRCGRLGGHEGVVVPRRAESVLATKNLSLAVSSCSSTLLSGLDGEERRCRSLVDINRRFVEWKCRLRQLEQRVMLYRAWDVLPESLQRSFEKPPGPLETMSVTSSDEQDVVLVEAWKALEDYINRSWHRLKQCVDAIVKDIRQRELLTEIELRIIHVRCSPPVMWIIPSPYVAFPRTLILDAWKTLAMQNTSSELAVVPVDESLWYLLSLVVPLACDGDECFLPCVTAG